MDGKGYARIRKNDTANGIRMIFAAVPRSNTREKTEEDPRMSSGSELFTDTAIHAKLEPPRSLHGVEDADVIWDTITRRFPNAAPLLCEMETVIERAEDLLQQLKTPCAHQENDTSSSFHTPDSRESNATISMVSDIESFAEETNCEKKHPCQGYHLNSPSRVDEIVQHFKTSTMNKCDNSQEESKNNADKAIGISSEERLMTAIAETNSLEGWTKVTDNALREWHDDMEDDNDSETRPNIDRNIENHPLMANDNHKCDKIDKKDSVAKSSAATANRRSPWTILEEYAKRCKVSIKYEYKLKPNLLDNVPAMSCAATEDLAKNKLAAKILWMIAECQMDGSKLSRELLDFSRAEMLDITAFNKDELKNALQKLYKSCLEKGESIPKYTIRKTKTNQGFMYTAQCVALGRVGIGQGVRGDSAKIAAAENLYQKYICEAAEQQSLHYLRKAR
ncbi:Uncharacterized protein DBV15_00223 [Temnothorax longispinosus]|uniref:DRBM domain-containing protein n=1 Tax=Temnothorax longispinosus TaxID=300112 RepID=A0A4S2KDM1_9HYME|nr:Uncharacterized protein DBV15_00223 [Temnothorax longispinosus]